MNIKSERYVRVSGIATESIVDGYGIRYVLFTQGCPHKCVGCHNPQTHDFSGGYLKSIDEIYIEVMKNPMLAGLTFSGGEPLMQPKPLLRLAEMLHKKGLNLILYTGFTFEQILNMKNKSIFKLLNYCSFLIDGKFEISKRDLTLQFRGSSNQRILDVSKSLKKKKAHII